jgi:predicted ribosomally synthesized peptide with nif11-like leader
MSQADLEQFCQLVLDDSMLQEQLRNTADYQSFLAIALQLSQDKGYCITTEDLESALREKRQMWLERWVR